MPGGIKELIADVEVKTVDVGAEVISDAKLNLDVGRWASGSFVSGSTSWVGTAAFTVLMGFIKVTAAAAGFVTMGTTADADAVFACTSTLATTFGSLAGALAVNAALRVVTAENTGIVDFAAGESVVISAGDSVAGKYYFLYIATAV